MYRRGRLGKRVQRENPGGEGGGASGISRRCHFGRLGVARLARRPTTAGDGDGVRRE